MIVRVLDLFCGAGGASEGYLQAGLEIAVAVDNDAQALESHAANHPDTEHLELDLTDTDAFVSMFRTGEFDLVHGSPPCQDFSMANTQNADPERGMILVRAYERIVDALSPRWFVMENVRAVRNYLGSFYPKIRILDAVDFGTPQHRKRVFSGHYPDPVHTHSRHGGQSTLTGNRLQKWVSVREALDLAGTIYTNRDLRDGETQCRLTSEPAPTFTAEAGRQWKVNDRMEVVDGASEARHNGPGWEHRRARGETGERRHPVEGPLLTSMHGDPRWYLVPEAQIPEQELEDDLVMFNGQNRGQVKGQPNQRSVGSPAFTMSGKGNRFRLVQTAQQNRNGPNDHDADEPSRVVDTQGWHLRVMDAWGRYGEQYTIDTPSMTVSATENKFSSGSAEKNGRRRASYVVGRQLTVEECAALQGFPVGYQFLGSRSSCYKQVGNAIPPPVARAIGLAMVQHRSGESSPQKIGLRV